MKYTITEQYARSEEKPIAEFNELHEARLFITKKSVINDDERKKVIYRLYDDAELFYELNQDNISITHANYAEGNNDFSNTAPFIFQVMISTLNSIERKTIAQFNNKTDAYLFIVSKFEQDNTVIDTDLFLLVKDDMLIDTVNKTIIATRKKGSSAGERDATYSLSPLSTRPTPCGGPPDYWVKNEDDEDNQK